MDTVPQTESDATSVAAYWGVIPAPVRYCKSLPPAAKLLFSEITALCKREGYCWATNAHFQALYEVERYTVQRWLSALVREGFIRVDLVPGTGNRRIYDLTIPPPQKRDGGAAKPLPVRHKKVTPPPLKGGTEWYIESEKKKEKESDVRGGRFVGPGPVPARELQAKEGKVTASPSTVKSKSETPPSVSRLRQVQRVVSLTKDVSSKSKFEDLWDMVHAAGHPEVWQEAVERVKTLPRASSMASEHLSETFVGVVSILLAQAS